MNWKGQALFVLVQWLLPGAAILGLLAFFRRTWPERLPASAWDRLAVPFFLLSRVAYVVVLYSIVGYEGSGDFAYWIERARALLDGGVPGRDVHNVYGPLFPYLQGGALALTGGRWAPAVLAPFIVGDALAVFLGRRLFREIAGARVGDWVGAWLLLTPLLWHQVVVRAGKEGMFVGTLVTAVLLIHRGRTGWAWFTLAIGLCATKVTYAPYAAAVGLVTLLQPGSRRWRDIGVGGATVAAVVAFYTWRGGDVLAFAKFRGEGLWGLNAAALFQGVDGVVGRLGGRVTYALGMVAALVSGLVASRQRTGARRCVLVLAWVHAVSMLTQPYVTTNHVTQGLPFLLAVLAMAGDAPLARYLLWLAPLQGLLVCLTSATSDTLYVYGAAPATLLLHLGLLGVLFADLRDGASIETAATDPRAGETT